jgi:hypothetical protein
MSIHTNSTANALGNVLGCLVTPPWSQSLAGSYYDRSLPTLRRKTPHHFQGDLKNGS